MMADLLYDDRIREALKQVAHAAPNGYDSLMTLDDEILIQLLTHPDAVRVVWTTRFTVQLPEVDEKGYAVYNQQYELSHRCVVDPNHPTLDLTVPQSRTMSFGLTIEDMNFMWQRKHGDLFYIRYESGVKLPRTIMGLVLDPLK